MEQLNLLAEIEWWISNDVNRTCEIARSRYKMIPAVQILYVAKYVVT